MIDIIQSVLAFIIVLGVLITFHEYGHFWVARRCDVKILRFSIGFGKPIYSKVFGKDNTEFVIAALPLGGYVKMLDEREGEVDKADLPRSFNQKPLARRFAIVSAGPIFNFIFAVFAYWLVFIIGVTGLKPILGEIEPDSISANAGLKKGQEIILINNSITPTWSTAIEKLVNHTVNGSVANIKVSENNIGEKTVSLDLSQISIDEMAEGKLLEVLGMSVLKLNLPPIIGEVLSDSPAQKSGLLQYDEIITANDVKIENWSEWVKIIRSNPGQRIELKVLRAGILMDMNLTPDSIEKDGAIVGQIGAVAFNPDGVFDAYFTKESYSLFAAIPKAIMKTWDMSILTLKVLGKMLLGEASVKNLSGPISIAEYAGKSAGIGIVAFLGFMAIVSVSLGVLNLLPIPLLDGGHLMYYLVELAIGKPVSESTQILGQQIGLVLLLGLMSIAFYNDIVRLML